MTHRRCVQALALGFLVAMAACSDSGTDPGPQPLPEGDVATITVTPPSATLEMGTTVKLVAVAHDAAGKAVAARFTWESSSIGTAGVDSLGTVQALGEGTASVTASAGSVHSSPVAVTVTAAAAWPESGPTSAELIAAAEASGALTAEQALVYRVFGAFLDPRLPAQYRGARDSTIDDAIMRIAAQRLGSLSLASQTSLAPFFIAPGYAGSWYQTRFGGSPAATPVGGSARPAMVRSAGTCEEALEVFGFKTISTTHVSIHYDFGIGSQFDQLSKLTADIVATEADKVWEVETSTFGKTPVPDAGLAGNGCDGKVDVWVVNMVRFQFQQGKGIAGFAMPYTPGVCPSPSFITLPGNPDPVKVRAVLAHEFTHVLQLGSYGQSSCNPDYVWLGEATGNWAIDLVYPNDQWEQGYAACYAYEERLVPLDLEDRGPHANGYCDYPFLFYLARKYGNATVKAIWDRAEQGGSVDAIVGAVAPHGGIKRVWPEFALAFWNDYQGANQDYLHTEDALIWGMKEAFDRKDAGGQYGSPSTKVELQGGSRRTFELLQSAAVFPDGHELDRLSVHADYLKFTDAAVSSVLYVNAMALADVPNLKIQAMIKQGGAWKPAEDWTKVDHKSWCRDRKDERIEELVLVYSNSDGNPSGPPISMPIAPTVSVSNVGCARWEGTASVETVILGTPGGTMIVSAAGLAFEPEESDIATAGFLAFTSVAGGSVTGSSTTTCTTTSASGVIQAGDGRLLINLDNLVIGDLGPPPDRNILEGQGSTSLPTTETLTCAIPPITQTADRGWDWLQIPVPGHAVSADGRSIEGTAIETAIPGGFPATRTIKWKLTAVREP